ncbi:hypothetical protein BDZ89DRAFT_1135627 [Hymenopellis radicata]|nr:hypothetical protein BDZ89DRAFT_1135627 [Hymenopellis radicata]
MGGELVGYLKTIVIVPYGHRFRKHFSRIMGTATTLKQFFPMIETEVLNSLLDEADSFERLAAKNFQFHHHETGLR